MTFEYFFFHRLADAWSILGAGVIIGGSIYVAMGKKKETNRRVVERERESEEEAV
jgi:drug/metabolite transporter (DMT)-like permease